MYDVAIIVPDLDFDKPVDAANAARDFLGTEVFNHKLQFVVHDKHTKSVHLTDLEPRPALTQGLELPRMLVLSMNHITQDTDDMFRFATDDMPQFFPKHPWGDPDEIVGWMIPIVGDEPFPHTCPADLLAIRALAEAVGATWIMLDRDADTIASLPTYDW